MFYRVVSILTFSVASLAAQEISPTYHFAWGVIGAGPAGIAAVGTLLDRGVRSRSIIWIDPQFNGGNLQFYKNIQSNTPTHHFVEFFTQSLSLKLMQGVNYTHLNQLEKRHGCKLKAVVKPLQEVTAGLRKKVASTLGYVSTLHWHKNAWQYQAYDSQIVMHKVILATGAQPRTLPHEGKQGIPLLTALDPRMLAKEVTSDSVVAVYGGSHSAMNVMEHLLTCSVKKVVNVCTRLAIRFREHTDDGVIHPYSGLRGHTADWARKNIVDFPHCKIQRVLVDDPAVAPLLAECDFVIDAVGFEPSSLPQLIDAPPARNAHEIAPHLFTLGFVAPPTTRDVRGHEEQAVGILQFLHQAQANIPIWMKNDAISSAKYTSK